MLYFMLTLHCLLKYLCRCSLASFLEHLSLSTMTQTICHTCGEYQSGCGIKSVRLSARLKLLISFPRNFTWPLFVIRAVFISSSRQTEVSLAQCHSIWPVTLLNKLLHFKLMNNSPALSARFFVSGWHKTDALQNGLNAGDLPFNPFIFSSTVGTIFVWCNHRTEYDAIYSASSVWPKSLPFLRTFSFAVPEDLAWELQILQVAEHVKAMSQYWGLHHLSSAAFINSQVYGMIREMSDTKSIKLFLGDSALV